MSVRYRSLLVLAGFLAFTPAAIGQTANLGYNFEVSNAGESSYIPPDTNGAVGPGHIVLLANGRAKMFTKSGTQASSFTLNGFWSTRAGLSPGTSFDPRVVYDRQSGRWFATSNDGIQANAYMLIGVSPGTDPTAGTWFGIRHQMDASADPRWADYNQLAVGPTWLTVSNNMYDVPNVGTNLSTLVSQITIPKASLVAGNATGLSYKANLSPASYGFTPHPATDYFAGSTTQYTLAAYNPSVGSLQLSTISGTVNNPSYTDFASVIQANIYNDAPDAPQLGATELVATGDYRMSSQPVLVNGKLWAVHASGSNGVGVIRWYRINPTTNTLEAQGTLPAPAGLHVYYPSIAVNQQGDIVVGYSGSSTTTYPSIYYTVGSYNSGTGATTFSSPVLAVAGTGAITNGRFGDYSSTNIDPADPGVFWTFQEFGSPGSTWRTRATEVIPTRAGEVRWKTAAAGSFPNSDAWFDGVTPTSTDHVILSRWSTSSYTINFAGGVTLDRLSVRQTGSGLVTLSIPTGSTLSLTNLGTGASDTNGNVTSASSFAITDYQGTANVAISGGGTFSTVTTTIAASVENNTESGVGTGSLTISGTGTTWNNSGNVYLGGNSTRAGGGGALTVTNGAVANLAGTLVAYNRPTGFAANTTTVGTGSTLTATGLSNPGSGTVRPTVALSTASSQLVISGGSGTTFSGTISGAGSVTKSNVGTFTLAGANTYTGTTTITGGTLRLTGIGSFANSSTVSIGAGASLDAAGLTGGANFDSATGQFALASGQTLQGIGNSTTGVTVRPGATLRSGLGSALGTLAIAGDAILQGASGTGGARLTTVVSSDNTTSPDHSLLTASDLNLVANATNKLNFALALGNNPYFVQYQANTIELATVTGSIQLNGVPQAGVAIDPSLYSLSTQGFPPIDSVYQLSVDETGHSLVLTFTPVPEPGTVLAIAAAGLGLIGTFRRVRGARTP